MLMDEQRCHRLVRNIGTMQTMPFISNYSCRKHACNILYIIDMVEASAHSDVTLAK